MLLDEMISSAHMSSDLLSLNSLTMVLLDEQLIYYIEHNAVRQTARLPECHKASSLSANLLSGHGFCSLSTPQFFPFYFFSGSSTALMNWEVASESATICVIQDGPLVTKSWRKN